MIKKWQISLATALMILGLLISFQFRTQQNILSDLKKQKTEDLLVMADNLNSKNNELLRQETELKQQLGSLQQNSNEGQTLHQSLEKDMANMDIALGTTKVKGSGIVITLSDINISPEHLPSIINDLWNSGAEAIAVNGIRINYKTTFFADERNLATVNGHTLENPLVIQAIGPPDTLIKVAIPGRDLDWYKTIGNPAEIKQVDNIILPAVVTQPIFTKAIVLK